MVINFRGIPVDLPEIPREWMYSYYLNLREPLDGRRIRVNSPFNIENTPSMFLYVEEGNYRWKDFSSSKGGANALQLCKALFEQASGCELSYTDVIKLIKDDYKVWTAKYGEFKPTVLDVEHFEYEAACGYRIRPWEDYDIKYWEKFNITVDLLNRHYVKALEYFQLGKSYTGGTVWRDKHEIRNSYGFFDSMGTLVKIYNPLYTDLKHINLRKDLLFRDSSSRRNDILILASSGKDALAILSLKLKVDVMAPMSEKAIVTKRDMDLLQTIYPYIFTLFDNDPTGIRAMILYQKLYGIDYIYFPHEKDISEAMDVTRDPIFIAHELTISLNKKLHNDTISKVTAS